MNTKLQHTSIRASAGTGKTYQLANRYLALLLLQAMAGGTITPEKIVAMTFTRKGAGEFAERILHRLAAAAGDQAELKKLQADLILLVKGDSKQDIAGLAPGVELVVDAPTLQSALEVMVDQYDRLVLGTIDGFMARSVQTLAFELGLGGFAILEEAAIEREREELLAQVFQSVAKEDLESFYQTLKRATLKSSSGRRSELGRFVKNYHKLLHLLPEADAWGGKVFWGKQVPSAPNRNWQSDAAALAEQIADHNFGHASINKSLASTLNWLAWRMPGSSAGKIPGWLDQEGKLAELWPHWPAAEWTFDYQKKPRTVPATVMRPLKTILESWMAAERDALSQKTGAIHEIVARYEQLYDALARRKGRLTFDDLPLLLDEQKSTESTQAALLLLGFRWFQRFDHWLLDEFQDTSRVQWSVLKPWLDEAIQDGSGTKSVFVVGDPKQSIYGWRGGEPRLFDELAKNYPGTFKQQIMAESWRSRPAVLELVNRVCAPEKNPALRDPDKFSPDARQRWQYNRHESAKNRQTEAGYAAVLLAVEPVAGEDGSAADDAEKGDDWSDKLALQSQVIKSVLEEVRPLEKGLSCAILVRKNENAQAVAQWLRSHGVPQVMVEGVATLAEQSPVVAAIVDALRWLTAPANTLAAGHVSMTPLWEILTEPLKKSAPPDLPAGMVWRHWRERIAEVGATHVTDTWCTALTATQNEPYTQYCLRHVSQAAQQADATVTMPDWLAVLEQLEVRETAAVGSIHVMTIHKSKGLGFDVVFLPDLDAGSGGADEILIHRDQQGCAVGCLAYPPKWLQGWQLELADLCAAQKGDQHLESLCVLYVALTRAKEATFVILNQEKPPKASPARDWILSALPGRDAAAEPHPVESVWGDSLLQWESGERNFSDRATGIRAPSAAPQPPLALLAPIPRRRRRKPSDAGHDAIPQRTTTTDSNSGKEFGNAVHDVFEQIEWWLPDQSLVGNMDAIALVRKCLARPEIRSLFAPESLRDEALRELPVEFMEQNLWWSGVVDRLVLRRDVNGILKQAVLIDFKTDRVETAAALGERYAEQLTIYRRALAAALKLGDRQIKAILISTHLDALVRV